MVGFLASKLTLLQSFLLHSTVCSKTSFRSLSGMPSYQLKPIKLGAEVRGIDLKEVIDQNTINEIKEDVTKHRLLVFRDQGKVSGARHVEISQWFGELDSTFYKHPRSPHPDVFRVSNDEEEGCTGVGRTGWHIDGSFQPAPFAYSLYHIWSVPSQGDTVFAPLTELVDRLSPVMRERWERLWMVSDRRIGRLHPLIYSHPITANKTLCFHLGMTEAFVWDYETDKERVTDWRETAQILKEILQEFVKDGGAIQYSHKWEAGDFIISDNIALGHEASPYTQLPKSQVGLRVMHRTTVKGHKPPRKDYNVQQELQQLKKQEL